jgi:hypothetical protein
MRMKERREQKLDRDGREETKKAEEQTHPALEANIDRRANEQSREVR